MGYGQRSTAWSLVLMTLLVTAGYDIMYPPDGASVAPKAELQGVLRQVSLSMVDLTSSAKSTTSVLTNRFQRWALRPSISGFQR